MSVPRKPQAKARRDWYCQGCCEYVDGLERCKECERWLCSSCADRHAWRHEEAAGAAPASEAPV